MLGKKEDWEEVRYDAERKPRAESGRDRWNDGNGIYGRGCTSAPARRSGIHRNPKLEGVMFDVLGNALKMAVCLKINVERCSEYAGSEFKDDPVGAASAIQTRVKPPNPEPTKSKKEASEVDIIIWKDDYVNS